MLAVLSTITITNIVRIIVPIVIILNAFFLGLIVARLSVGFVRYFSETRAANLTSFFEMLTRIAIFTFGVRKISL